MKQLKKQMLTTIAAVMLSLLMAVPTGAANQKTTVTQVTEAVTLSEDVDYIITSSTPFVGDGLVNITNTEHAVVILESVRPSKAISWLKNIQINGVRAVNNTNCMVKIYNLGCIILPYAGGDKFKPLTVYSEPNFEGESCNDFGLEHSGGYMNTLTDEKLNNRISSFRLKRGYMVTFSLKAEGRGYSRCFIAADKDVEMAKLPGLLDNSISSYRVFKWYDTGKRQLASCTDKTILDALNVQSCYDWGQGNSSLLPDYEWVPNHIYEDWPSSATIGSTTQSPHTKTNNEPFNSSDDRPQDLNTILGNWENMMRTGLRLCSPASHDGALTQHHAFLDSIDARGWRCDIIDLHCYWNEWNFYNSIKSAWVDRHHRPVWISEWVWGSSWGNNGIFNEAQGTYRDNPTAAQLETNKEVVERICTALNGYDYIERYYYWNSEANCSKLYYGGKRTPAGEMYAKLNSGVGYNGKYDYVPKTPKQYDPSDLTITFDKTTHVATLTWKEYNGEMNASMSVERRPGTGKAWTTIATIDLEDGAATYTYEDKEATNGCLYQIVVVDANNTKRYTKTVMAASDDLEAGDAIDVDGQTKYLGGNIIANGSFEMGFMGWKDGKGNMPAAPYFQVVPVGGNDGGTYMQAYGNELLSTESAINTSFAIKDSTDYYFSVASCNMPSGYTNRLGLSEEGKTSTSPKVYINNTTANWLTQFGTFNSEGFTQARINLYSLGATAQVDQMMLCQLFSTKDSAIADGIEKARQKAEMFKEYNTKYASLNDELTQLLAAVTTTDAEALATAEEAVRTALLAYEYKQQGESRLLPYAKKLLALNLYDSANLETAITGLEQANAAAEVEDGYNHLQNVVDDYLPQTAVKDKVSEPKFAKETGWTTKCGTYTGGDQRIATKDGMTCWNAWWANIDATETDKSMAVKQNVTNLPHGLYALECKAATEHYCISDQHGFITNGDVNENTQPLSANCLDLNVPVDNHWETLFTAPVYVEEGGALTIGFTGSKNGAMDNGWLSLGNPNTKNDKREGWWCATDFALRFTPLYKKAVVPGQLGVVCLPYNARPSEGMKLYQVVGINSDYTQLFLEEVEGIEAGVPCIYATNASEAVFYEYGDAVTKVGDDAPGNIRGFLKTTARVPVGYYYVKDGAFEKVTGDRPDIGYFTGIMRPFTDRSSKAIPVLESWSGQTMAISGVTDEEKAANATGIHLPTASGSVVNGLYTIDGRYLSPAGTTLKPGLYIRVVDGKACKTVIK